MATLAQVYTAYGYSKRPSKSTLLGFNGERLAVELTSYLLGNGYRAFSPALMRFLSADSFSPFGEGGVNSYAFCSNDPVNRQDPSGHGFERNALSRRPVRIKPVSVKKVQQLTTDQLVERYNTLGSQMVDSMISKSKRTHYALHEHQMLLISELASRQDKRSLKPLLSGPQGDASSATPMIDALLNPNDPFPPKPGPTEAVAEQPAQSASRLRKAEWF